MYTALQIILIEYLLAVDLYWSVAFVTKEHT